MQRVCWSHSCELGCFFSSPEKSCGAFCSRMGSLGAEHLGAPLLVFGTYGDFAMSFWHVAFSAAVVPCSVQ